jgi:hypothetical protein
MVPAVVASRTKNLSFGERPVWVPVMQTSGPPAAICPSLRRTASSYNADALRLRAKWAPGTSASKERRMDSLDGLVGMVSERTKIVPVDPL